MTYFSPYYHVLVINYTPVLVQKKSQSSPHPYLISQTEFSVNGLTFYDLYNHYFHMPADMFWKFHLENCHFAFGKYYFEA